MTARFFIAPGAYIKANCRYESLNQTELGAVGSRETIPSRYRSRLVASYVVVAQADADKGRLIHLSLTSLPDMPTALIRRRILHDDWLILDSGGCVNRSRVPV